MLNLAKYCISSTLLTLLCLTPHSPCVADTLFKDETTGISLNIPTSFQQLEIKHPGLIAAFKSKDSDYPSFNILRFSGSFPRQGTSLSAAKRQVLEEYRLVGLRDTEIKSSSQSNLEHGKSYDLQLSYDSKRVTYTSSIRIVNLAHSHLIFTYVDKASEYEPDLPLLRLIFGSIVLEPTHSNSGVDLSQSTSKTGITLASGLILAMLLGFLVLLIRIRHGKSKHSRFKKI